MDNPFARRGPVALEVAGGARGPGHIDLLVAVTREPGHVASLDGFTESIGPDLGTVTLARPATGGAGRSDRAEADLATAALFVSSVRPRLLVLPDPSPRTLHRLVLAEQPHLVVVLDDPACAAELERLTARRSVRVMGASILTPRGRPDR